MGSSTRAGWGHGLSCGKVRAPRRSGQERGEEDHTAGEGQEEESDVFGGGYQAVHDPGLTRPSPSRQGAGFALRASVPPRHTGACNPFASLCAAWGVGPPVEDPLAGRRWRGRRLGRRGFGTRRPRPAPDTPPPPSVVPFHLTMGRQEVTEPPGRTNARRSRAPAQAPTTSAATPPPYGRRARPPSGPPTLRRGSRRPPAGR